MVLLDLISSFTHDYDLQTTDLEGRVAWRLGMQLRCCQLFAAFLCAGDVSVVRASWMMAVGVALLLSWGVAAVSRVRGDVVRSLECRGHGIDCDRKQKANRIRSPQHRTYSMTDDRLSSRIPGSSTMSLSITYN